MSRDALEDATSESPPSEVSAMAAIARALEGLDEAEVGRVLSWVGSRYGHPAPTAGQAPNAVGQFDDVGSLFEAVAPKTDRDRVLAVGYWYQVVGGEREFDALRINQECTNLGFRLSNVTSTFSRLSDQKPALAMQVRKSGSSQQARKKYRLTTEGVKWVERAIGGADDSD